MSFLIPELITDLKHSLSLSLCLSLFLFPFFSSPSLSLPPLSHSPFFLTLPPLPHAPPLPHTPPSPSLPLFPSFVSVQSHNISKFFSVYSKLSIISHYITVPRKSISIHVRFPPHPVYTIPYDQMISWRGTVPVWTLP